MESENIEIEVNENGQDAIVEQEEEAPPPVSSVKLDKTTQDTESNTIFISSIGDDSESDRLREKRALRNKRIRTFLANAFESCQYVYSMGLLGLSAAIVGALIFTKQTTGTESEKIHPATAFCLLVVLLTWLAVMEGGQVALVGLQNVDSDKYEATHGRTFRATKLTHRGDNMERFIIGRQFLVVMVLYLSTVLATSIEDAQVLGFNQGASAVFVYSSVALMLTTIAFQLTAQVNASKYMLDFVNNYIVIFSAYLSLLVEFTGLLHASYLIQILLSKVTRTPIPTQEPPRTLCQTLFFWLRVLFSVAVLGFAIAVTFVALFEGKTTMWNGIPPSASLVLFVFLILVVGLVEGMQIALFCATGPQTKTVQHLHQNQNMQAFLIGRQICVTACTYIIARITTVHVEEGEDNIFGLSDTFQTFFNTGLLGALITTILGSLVWRILASTFPTSFISNALASILIHFCLVLEMSGICSASWVLARWNKSIAGFQSDATYLAQQDEQDDSEEQKDEEQEAITKSKRDVGIDRTVRWFKYCVSLGLLLFSIVVLIAAFFTDQTTATQEFGIPAVATFFIFWILILWLGVMEGGQGALVGLQPVDKELYRDSHPRSLKNTTLAHKGDNMERFIVGRQFLVVLTVFVTNLLASSVNGASVFEFPQLLSDIFLSTGIALILTTIMVGQLTSQINSAKYMLDFINNYFMLFTTYLSLFLEFTGLLHATYLVQICFSKWTGKPIETDEPPRNPFQQLFFALRVLFSLLVLGVAFAVTFVALYEGKTTMWDGVPAAVSVVLFFVLVAFAGMMEGMQIALFSVVKLPQEELRDHPLAFANCQLVFQKKNLQAFLIGRQIWVTICTFVLARITTIHVEDSSQNIFGVPDALQSFFNTGLLGAVITTIVSSLAWRVVASSYPIPFLSNPLVYLILRLCLILELSGLCSASWLLAIVQRKVLRFQPDEVYIGTNEDRSIHKNRSEDTEDLEMNGESEHKSQTVGGSSKDSKDLETNGEPTDQPQDHDEEENLPIDDDEELPNDEEVAIEENEQ